MNQFISSYMEKGNNKRVWKDAFEGAEVAPSDSIWTNIELDLEKAAGGKMKQRILFYKMLAAASVVFAMVVAGAYYLSEPEDNTSTLAQVDTLPGKALEPQTTPESSVQQTVAADAINNSSVGSENLVNRNKETVSRKENSISKNTNSNANANANASSSSSSSSSSSIVNRNTDTDTQNSAVVSNSTAQGIAQISDDDYSRRFQSPLNSKLISKKNPELIIPIEPQSTADPGMLLLAKLKDEEKKYQDKEKKNSTENIWTSVGFAAGSFNPNSTNNSATLNASAYGPIANTTTNSPTSGSSYSFGVQVGGKVSERFVLLGGISYLTQNASFTSNTASLEASNATVASLNDYAFKSTNQAVTTSPYDVNSNLQFVSVPLQAGYVIVDRKFAIQLNGGVATDFFLLNTLTPEADYIDKVSQGPGEDSPYRTVNFSGLVGTEFSYRLADRYRIALNPGMRYALNSIYKTEISTEISPITYDVALKFRYIFK